MINMATIRSGAKVVAKFAIKHLPEILSAIGVIAMGAATVHAINEAPKAKEDIEALDNNPDLDHKTYNREKAKCLIRHYWPTVTMSLGGAGLIFGGQKISLGRTAAALAALQIKTEDLEKWKRAIKETDGDKKLESLRQEVIKDSMHGGPENGDEIIKTGRGETLCFESISGRYFYSDIESIRRAVNLFNKSINDSAKYSVMTGSLNEWYDFLGLEHIEIGDRLGWVNRLMDVKFDSHLTTSNVPCLVLSYDVEPTWDYDIVEDSSDYQWR